MALPREPKLQSLVLGVCRMTATVGGKASIMTNSGTEDLLTCAKDDCNCLIRVERPCPHGGTIQCGCGGEMVAATAADVDRT